MISPVIKKIVFPETNRYCITFFFKIYKITLDPDPNWAKILDPNPNSMYDVQPHQFCSTQNKNFRPPQNKFFLPYFIDRV